MVADLIVRKVIGEVESEAIKELGLCWKAFRTNWFNFAYNFPGTTVYRFMKVHMALFPSFTLNTEFCIHIHIC